MGSNSLKLDVLLSLLLTVRDNVAYGGQTASDLMF
jgi:hypothetical protein